MKVEVVVLIRDVRWDPGPWALRAGHGPERGPSIIILARFSHGLIRAGPCGLGPVWAYLCGRGPTCGPSPFFNFFYFIIL